MKKVFVTGGTSFIGWHVITQLLAGGYDVYAAVSSREEQALLTPLGTKTVLIDLFDRSMLLEYLADFELVLHLLINDSTDIQVWRDVELVNVTLCRVILESATAANVSRIVVLSSAEIEGLVDLSDSFPQPDASPILNNHVRRTLLLAYSTVIRPLINKGAPIVTAMVGRVYGPKDPGIVGELMRRFYLRQPPFPFLPGPDTVWTFAHVEDVATGVILAAENGEVGQRYCFTGPAVSLGEMVDFWARLTGKRAPTFHIPSSFLRPLLPFVHSLETVVALPQVLDSAMIAQLGEKRSSLLSGAEAELGWQLRSLQTGMIETLATVAADADESPQPISRERQVITVALFLSVTFIAVRLLRRNSD